LRHQSRKQNPIGSKLIDMGRSLAFVTVAANMILPQCIDQKNEDVRLFRHARYELARTQDKRAGAFQPEFARRASMARQISESESPLPSACTRERAEHGLAGPKLCANRLRLFPILKQRHSKGASFRRHAQWKPVFPGREIPPLPPRGSAFNPG
jgi:hypothetical protein